MLFAVAVVVSVGEDLVEGEVVEHLDELRVGDLQFRLVVGEQPLVVLAGRLRDAHDLAFPCPDRYPGSPAALSQAAISASAR